MTMSSNWWDQDTTPYPGSTYEMYWDEVFRHYNAVGKQLVFTGQQVRKVFIDEFQRIGANLMKATELANALFHICDPPPELDKPVHLRPLQKQHGPQQAQFRHRGKG